MNNYDWLLSRLDRFIRKYYANKLLRGSILLLTCLLFYVLSVSVGEYFLYMPVWLRVSIVTIFILMGLFAMISLVVIPLLQMAKLGKIISHEQAASIVGKHFPEINDKLLNILQLKRQTEEDNISRELIEASINQKAIQLSVIPISKAIDFSKNKKLLPYLLPLLLIGIFILVAAPNVFRAASERLLQPTKSFEKPAPFEFHILSQPLIALRNNDFVLKLEMLGNALPQQVFIVLNDEQLPMQQMQTHQFQYTFRNATEPIHFRLYAAGFYSQEYVLKIVQKPLLKSFKVLLDYPDYTGKKDEERSSLGDLTIPAGTKVSWLLQTEFTDAAKLHFINGAPFLLEKNNNTFNYSFRFLNDTAYTLILQNKQSSFVDSYQYHVQVIPDEYPVLQVKEVRDTVSGKQIFLSGTAGDDYGITKVLFHYDITTEKNENVASKTIALKTNTGTVSSFEHYFDVAAFNLQPGQKLSYFIEAWDNDGVHGSKASRSEVFSYFNYTKNQLDSAIIANAQQINSGLSNSSQQTKQLQNDFKELQNKLLQDNNMDWQQQHNLQELAEQQMKLQTEIENVKKRFDEQKQQSNQKQYSEDVKEKQEELQKQLDNLLNNELKEQMKKLQELMQKLNKENAFKTMQQMEQENKLFDMDLKRMQELMKQLELQMRLEDVANKMDELAKKQLALKDQTDKQSKPNDALNKEQEALKKELDKTMSEDMKQARELNNKTQSPQDMQKPEQKGQEAGKNMQQSEQSLQQNQNSQSSQSQSKAAENMQEMADILRQQASGMNVQQIEIDIKATRQILTNLIRLSFDQETLMKNVQQTSVASQAYLVNQQQQKRLHSNSIMIKDSLFVLSKRIFQLAATVNKETTELEDNMQRATDALENRKIMEAATDQQYVMTHTNNLALMLNEILTNLLQMKNKAQQPGKGMCNKPGGMNPKPGAGQQLSDIITKQKNLGNAMQQMQDAQKQGEQQGEGKTGSRGKNGKEGNNENEYGSSEQIARLAQQQAAIRRQLQELQSILNSKGIGNSKELREIQDKMDKNETDLVNKRFSSEMLMRHKEILMRLLETEKALREQEQDNKRTSKEIGELSRPVPPELQQYIHNRQKMMDFYRTVPAQLKPYYKNMVEQYYKNIGSGK